MSTTDGPKYPLIFTCCNDAIDKKLVKMQHDLISKMVDGRIAFRPMYHQFDIKDMDHGDILNKSLYRLFYEASEYWDCILILDIDAIPLSYHAIEKTLMLAYSGTLVGNIQRSNHFDNDKHTYVAPSYMCFTREYYERAGSPTMNANHKYDTGELLTVNAERFGLPVTKLVPLHSESGYDDNGSMWELTDQYPKYGIGTTFGIAGQPISYHLFGSRLGTWDHLFHKKCEDILRTL